MEILTQAGRFMESRGFHLMTEDEIPRFVRCAAESYGNIAYALDDYLVGHPCTKDELWEMWLLNLKYFYSRALIYSDSPDCNAWTLWIPPGFKGVSIVDFIRHGGVRMALRLGLPTMKRIMHYEDYGASVRLKATSNCEWYLYNLVVRPEAQGRHLAGKLVRPMLEYCAQGGRQAYLETHSEKNVQIYRHLGFEVVSNDPIPDTEVTHWGMVKSPISHL